MLAFTHAVAIGCPLDQVDATALRKFGRPTLFHIFEKYRQDAIQKRRSKIEQAEMIELVSPTKVNLSFSAKHGVTTNGKLID